MANFHWLKLPRDPEIALALGTLSPRRRRLFWLFGAVFLISLVGLLSYVNNQLSVVVPTTGGSLVEGVIGTPLYANPVLAASDTDRDVAALVYSGLMRVNAAGELIPDLAQSYNVSADGLVYDFVLRDDLKWQDGEPITADDVVFTVSKAQDPLVKSPRRASWEGVTVEKVSPSEVRFQLKQPFASFLETATMGILPKHLWNEFTPEQFLLNQLNTDGIGSGPYELTRIEKDERGIATAYEFSAFDDFALGEPNLSRLTLRFYPSESELVAAYQAGKIESASAISAAAASALADDGANIIRRPLTRVFGVFFNQAESPVLADLAVRQALEAAIDRQAIISSVLHGYGTPVTGPLPPATVATSTPQAATASYGTSTAAHLAAGREILTDHGWRWQEDDQTWTKASNQTLAFSLATSDAPELKATAETLREIWTALGAQVDLKIYEAGDLAKDLIRPRQYQALFFGQILGRTPDLFSFWHSKQRLDPGYNIALYTNLAVDKSLEELRTLPPTPETASRLAKAADTIAKDYPAVFVYSPDFLYLLPSKIKQANMPSINTPSDRFAMIHEWYVNTDKVWKIFSN